MYRKSFAVVALTMAAAAVAATSTVVAPAAFAETPTDVDFQTLLPRGESPIHHRGRFKPNARRQRGRKRLPRRR